MDKTTLLLVDDHVVMRKGLRLLLESTPEFQVAGEASNGREAVELTLQLEPDLVLMDLSLPEMDGVSAIRAIKEKRPQQKILALTMHDQSIYLEKALTAGANGFVLKRAADVELLTALHAILRGEFYIDPGLSSYLVEKVVPGAPSHSEAQDSARAELTPREIEILRLVAMGHSNKEIAEKLAISVKTVENHKTRIKERLGAQTRSDLVRYAMAKGLLE
jgi:two-component system response regulator NreC